jgi:predicted transcriptional regulator
MTTLQVRIETFDDFGLGVVEAMNDLIAGRPRTPHFGVSFNSYEDMYAVLSPSRLALVRVLAGQGALSIREVARRLERDVQAVHRDVTRLVSAGVINRTDEGIRFDHDEIEFSFKVRADKVTVAA